MSSTTFENIAILERELDPFASPEEIHVFAMKVARVAGMDCIHRHPDGTPRTWDACDSIAAHAYIARAYPLPPTLVLREEAVPDAGHPDILYRWVDGGLERKAPLSGVGWEPWPCVESRLDLMRHAIDLSERPYREEPQ